MLERCLIKQCNTNHMHHIKPRSNLTSILYDKISWEIIIKFFFVFKWIMKLCIWHTCTFHPTIKHITDTFIYLAIFDKSMIVDPWAMHIKFFVCDSISIDNLMWLIILSIAGSWRCLIIIFSFFDSLWSIFAQFIQLFSTSDYHILLSSLSDVYRHRSTSISRTWDISIRSGLDTMSKTTIFEMLWISIDILIAFEEFGFELFDIDHPWVDRFVDQRHICPRTKCDTMSNRCFIK